MKLTHAIMALLLATTSSAHAGATIANRSYDDGTSLMFVARICSDFVGVRVVASAFTKPPRTVRSVQIQGNKLPIATCQTELCIFNWPRAAMRAGSNDISVLATLSDGAAYITTGTMGQPPATIPTPCTPCFLLDDKGGWVLDSLGLPLTCN